MNRYVLSQHDKSVATAFLNILWLLKDQVYDARRLLLKDYRPKLRLSSKNSFGIEFPQKITTKKANNAKQIQRVANKTFVRTYAESHFGKNKQIRKILNLIK